MLRKAKNAALVFLFAFGLGAFLFGIWFFRNGADRISSPLTEKIPKTQIVETKPLSQYTIESLGKSQFAGSKIDLGKVVKEESGLTSYVFYFWVEGPSMSSGHGKKVSGLLNLPESQVPLGVIVLFRGYVDREIYSTGVGTQRVGEELAKRGFVTLAPDFLGYGESEDPSADPLEERFQTYMTALTLLASLKNLNETFTANNLKARADASKIGIWGHSNGGQIALTVLEITGFQYPTVLWAPVSKPFPYSVLYYTDDSDDHGKMLRRLIADFEKDYDAELYSITNYFDRINAQVQIHQGEADDAVPLKWSDELVEKLKELDKEVAYFIYPSDDHNLAKGGWNLAVSRSVEFYRENL